MLDVLRALAGHARDNPAAPAICTDDERLDYRGLLNRVRAAAAGMSTLPGTVAIAGPNGIDWVAADLALGWTGRRMVPIPPFFSPAQIAHLVRDAGIGAILWTGAETPEAIAGNGVPVAGLSRDVTRPVSPPRDGAERIIYTSGTTGAPRGVIHGARQLDFSLRALAGAAQASASDLHLCCLPFALLLEQICGIHLPIFAGGRLHIAPPLSDACARGALGPLAQTIAAVRPTTAVLIPQQLTGLVAALGRAGAVAPDSLRFVAVGGAPVAPSLIETAWTLGIPAHEGYGLSECCSVVALNRPGEAVAGSVGRPLDGLTVVLDEGEIVVRGDSVMTGYLGGARLGPGACWRTGDLGAFDADGRLIVRGRKDNVIVTGFGRNVNPEWIEALVLADPRIARAVLMGHGAAGVVLAIWLAAPAEATFDVDARIADLTASAPPYARPLATIVAGPGDVSPTLFTASGRPRRAALASHFSRRVTTALATFKAETLMEMK